MLISRRLADAPPALAALHAEHIARQRRMRGVAAAPEPLPPPPPPPKPKPAPEPPPVIPQVFVPAPVLAPIKGGACPKFVEGPKVSFTVPAIVNAVAVYFDIAPRIILSNSRRARVSYARQVAVYLTRRLTTYSRPQVGGRFGRDHTTVLHAERKIAWMRSDPHGSTGRELVDILRLLGVEA